VVRKFIDGVYGRGAQEGDDRLSSGALIVDHLRRVNKIPRVNDIIACAQNVQMNALLKTVVVESGDRDDIVDSVITPGISARPGPSNVIQSLVGASKPLEAKSIAPKSAMRLRSSDAIAKSKEKLTTDQPFDRSELFRRGNALCRLRVTLSL
jgi:hypothetical protein